MTNKNCFNNCKECPAWERSVLRDLDDKTLQDLHKNKTPNNYSKGQTLFMQGNPSFGLYCVGNGNIKISKISGEGKESIVRIADGGKIVGHRSIFANQPYQGTATALSQTQACFIDKNYLLDLVKKNVSIANYTLFSLASDLGVCENKLAIFSQFSVRERLAALLLILKESHGVVTDNETLLKIDLSREEMASLMGTAPETLIRHIAEFKQEKIIRLEKKMLVIIDLEKAEKLANKFA